MTSDNLNSILSRAASTFTQIWNFELYNSGTNVIVLNQLIIASAIIFFGLAINKRLSKSIGNH